MSGVADSVVRQSNRMRKSLDGTGRSVTHLRSAMSQGYRARLFDQMLRQASSVNNELGRMRAALLGVAAITGAPIAGAMSGAWLLQTADRAHLLRNQLATVTDGSENLLAVQQRLYDLSQRTRSEMQSTVTIYARTARAVEHLGMSQESLIRVTETIQKAFAIGGASQAEAMGAAIQLSQGIASDRFSGEEYRSVAENAPVLLRGMADALGVNIGKLREMAHAGELTGEVVTNAILKASGKIDVAFDKVGVTAGQAFTRLSNAFLMYAGDVDSSLGTTRQLANVLTNVADNFEEVVKWAAGLAAIIGGPILARWVSGGIGKAGAGAASWFAMMGVGKEGAEAKKVLEERLRIQKELVAMGAKVGQGGRISILASAANVAQMEAFNKKLSAYNALTARAIAATESLTKAQRVGAVAGRVWGSALGLLGGYTGIAFLGLIAGIGAMSAHMAALQERTTKLKEELYGLGMISDEVAGITQKTAKSLEELAADEIRNKLREINAELERMRGEQNIFEKMFGYDPQQLGNIQSHLEGLLNGRDGWLTAMLSPADTAAVKDLLEIVKQLRAGEPVEDFADRLDAIATSSPELADSVDDIIGSLRLAVPYMEALAANAERVETAARLAGMEFASDQNLIRLNDALEARVAAERTLADISAEMMRQAGMSEEEARIEKVVAALRKEADGRGDISALKEEDLQQTAKQIIAAEDHAKAMAEIADLRKSMQVDGLTLIDRDAAARVNILLDQFATGNMRVETMKAAMAEIAGLRLSKAMDGLIERIVAAIPQLATLLGIAQSFPGVGPQGPVNGRGAVGRARRESAAKRAIGADSVQEAIRVAGLSERDAFIENKAAELVRTAKELGGVLSMDAALEAAARIYEIEQGAKSAGEAMDDAADRARKFADGMADLETEVRLAPLGDFTKSVYDAADGMGLSREELDGFIDSVTAGGLDAAPEKFRAIADAMREIRAVGILDDLAFESDQAFRSETEQRVFETLRDTGIELDSVYGRLIDRQIRMIDQMKEAADVTKEFASGLVSDLMNGVSWTEALGNAFGRLGERLIQMALDQAIQMLFQNLLGAAFGGIGGGFSPQLGRGLTGASVFGGTGGVYGIPGFDEGGYTGGRRGSIAGLVHGEEFVVKAGPAARYRGMLEAMNDSRPLPTGITIAPNYSIDARGSAMTEREFMALLDRNNRQLRRDLPAMIADARRRGEM